MIHKAIPALLAYCLTVVPLTGTAGADSSVKVFKYKNRSGVTSFSDRAPENRRYQVVEISFGLSFVI